MREETGSVDKKKADEGKVLWGHKTRTHPILSLAQCARRVRARSTQCLEGRQQATWANGKPNYKQKKNSRALCQEVLLM